MANITSLTGLVGKDQLSGVVSSLVEFIYTKKTNVSDVYNTESHDAMSGIAVAEAIRQQDISYYSDITLNGTLSYGSTNISGDGGELSPESIPTYSQTKTYREESEEITSGATIVYYITGDGFSIDPETGKVTASKNTGEERIAIVTMNISLNDKTKSIIAMVKQDKVFIYNDVTISAFTYGDESIGSDGGSLSPTLAYSQTDNYDNEYTDGATVVYSIEGDGFRVDESTGVVTAVANTGKEERTATVTATVTLNGKTATKTATVKQKLSVTPLYTILCSDGTFVTPTVNETDGTVTSTNMPSDKTAIGVCVIPSDHMNDSKARFISLKDMSYSTPTIGTSSQNSVYMYWGGNGTDLSLTNHQEGYGPIGTQWPYGNLTTLYNGRYESSSYASSSYKQYPFPYNNDGSANADYRSSSYYTCDMDGKSNTDVIIAATTASWSSGDITNSYDGGNYPAACCCRRYAPSTADGLGAGNWFLPSEGEWGYVLAKYKLIDNLISAVGGTKLSNYYWSSTEYSSNNALNLYFNYGFCNYSTKYNTGCVRAFLAF